MKRVVGPGDFLLMASVVGISVPVVAQSWGTVSGTVSDSARGAPVVGAFVAIMCPECYGRHPTDTAGRYRFTQVPPGSFRLEIHCPSQAIVGREILNRTVTVAVGAETVINARVGRGHCAEPPYSEKTGTFRGYWTPGFESSAFRPCADRTLGVAAPLLPGKRLGSPRAWADFSPSAQLSQIVWPKDTPVDAWGNPTYFVVWHGTLKGPGTYGHLGVSAFSMIVDTVLSVSAHAPRNCRTK
jgi:hypothetical protein